MLQNRVDPFGQIIKTSARGKFTGTRGILHNGQREIVRTYKLKAWLTCLLEFKGRKRDVMAPDGYTSLFFLDEATAFSAGHRPCAECRRKDFDHFKTAWLNGNPEYHFNQKTPIASIDDILHQERTNHAKSKVTFPEKAALLPDGTFVSIDNVPFVVFGDLLHLWTPFGYTENEKLTDHEVVRVLTPRSVVKAFNSGYTPQIALMNTGN